MGCTARGGDSIHVKKRLLALTVIGAVLAVSAVAIVSLRGNDKPEITTNLPPASEQPASTPQTPVTDTVPQGTGDTPTAGPGNNGNGNGNGNGGGNGNGNGNGQSGSDDDQTPTDDGKAHGLERAIEVHLRNMDRQDAKGMESSSHDGKGLENSMTHLQENLEKQTSAENAGASHGNSHNT